VVDTVNNSVFRASDDAGQTWYTVTGANLTAGTFVIGANTYDLDIANNNVQAGDKALLAFYGQPSAATRETLQVTAPGQDGAGPIISYADGDLLNATTTVEVATMDTNGNVTFGSIDVTFGDYINDSTSDVTFDITASGGLAQGSTALYFVDRSYDNVGNFIWGDSGQYLTIYNAAGKNTSIFIDGADTLQEVADKVENAITGVDGLNMASGISDVDAHVADFVTTAIPNSDEAVAGTIVIRSPKQGLDGKLSFSASEDVLKFFSFADIQDPRDAIDPLTVTVYNAHTGELIGSDTVSDNVLRNVIKGVEVRIDSNVDVDVAWNESTRKFDFTSATGVQTEHLHIVDRSVTFQIGANRGQQTKSYIAEMTGAALDTNNVLVISQELAALAIQKVDNAINLVSSERARIGGNISRLEHTINNLNVQAENAVASESRIRDLDMAQEMTEMTKQQLLLQASTAMLAQANQVPQILLQLLR
jgi:flagellin